MWLGGHLTWLHVHAATKCSERECRLERDDVQRRKQGPIDSVTQKTPGRAPHVVINESAATRFEP